MHVRVTAGRVLSVNGCQAAQWRSCRVRNATSHLAVMRGRKTWQPIDMAKGADYEMGVLDLLRQQCSARGKKETASKAGPCASMDALATHLDGIQKRATACIGSEQGVEAEGLTTTQDALACATNDYLKQRNDVCSNYIAQCVEMEEMHVHAKGILNGSQPKTIEQAQQKRRRTGTDTSHLRPSESGDLHFPLQYGAGVHMDPLNEPLLQALGAKGVLLQGDAVLDVGCGCGVWGIAAALTGLPSRVLCTDIDPISVWMTHTNAVLNDCSSSSCSSSGNSSIGSSRISSHSSSSSSRSSSRSSSEYTESAAAAAAAAAAATTAGVAVAVDVECGDMLGAIFQPLSQSMSQSSSSSESAPVPLFDLVVCNPPQTGGPEEFERLCPDKYGGSDGSRFYLQLARDTKSLLNPGGRILYCQIGLAHPKRVAEAFEAAGFGLEVVAEQTRQFDRTGMEAKCNGLFDYQLAQREKGEAEFDVNADGSCEMFQRVVLATLKT